MTPLLITLHLPMPPRLSFFTLTTPIGPPTIPNITLSLHSTLFPALLFTRKQPRCLRSCWHSWISFYISSICHSIIYLILLDSKSPFSNYKTSSSFMEPNLLTKTRGHHSIHASIMIKQLVPRPYQIRYLVSV